MKKQLIALSALTLLSTVTYAERQGPWTKERAWEWYNAQPWIRGVNYMPASAANHLELWQEYGSEERFKEVEREMALAEKVGFNTMRVILSQWGFAAWYRDHDGFMRCFERVLAAMHRHGIRAIVVLGNDCSRPKEMWELPKLGPQSYDIGYHGGRRVTQHGSNPNAVGYTQLDDPELRPKFFAMCEELFTTYRHDGRILLWNLWNEPGNNNRSSRTMKDMRELFERAWKIDPIQPLAADIFTSYGGRAEGKYPVEKLAGELSDIISYHLYASYYDQKKSIDALRKRWGRPMINTEWLARIHGDEPATSYPLFAQEKVGCTCWGFVNGKYQTHEPYEPMWTDQFSFVKTGCSPTRWYHDLFRPSLHPYDPVEIEIIRRVNAEMDAERTGGSIRAKIAASCKVTGEDMWQGFRRTKFDFMGHPAWVVEPSVFPAKGTPWTWTIQWSEHFVDRTGVPNLLKRGYHHVFIDLFPTRMMDNGVRIAADFQKFLVEKLGFAPRTRLIGMSWGGFFSVRYTAAHPENVAKIYLDAPLLNFDGFGDASDGRIGPWASAAPADGKWSDDPRMPVNLAAPIAQAGVPILLLYGGQDQTVPPAKNCELFEKRFRDAGGKIKVERRDCFGHHPHGVDPDKTAIIVDFFAQ